MFSLFALFSSLNHTTSSRNFSGDKGYGKLDNESIAEEMRSVNKQLNNIKVIQEAKENPKKIKKKKCIFEDGEYTGEMLDTLPHGKGIFIYKNGDEYKGEFKKGMKDGNGYYKNKEGEYDGFWKNNKKDGHGKYTFKNGDLFMGEFKDDMFNGQGILLYSNGNKK